METTAMRSCFGATAMCRTGHATRTTPWPWEARRWAELESVCVAEIHVHPFTNSAALCPRSCSCRLFCTTMQMTPAKLLTRTGGTADTPTLHERVWSTPFPLPIPHPLSRKHLVVLLLPPPMKKFSKGQTPSKWTQRCSRRFLTLPLVTLATHVNICACAAGVSKRRAVGCTGSGHHGRAALC